MKKDKEFYKSKTKKDKIFEYITLCFCFLVAMIFIALLVFITAEAIKGFTNTGITNILFTLDFDASGQAKSFWIPFSVTIITSLLALVIAVPIGIRIAIFIKYRINKKYQNKIIILFQVLSGIPSVIFGLFAVNALGSCLNSWFGISKNSIFNSSIMLCFMVLPSIVSLTLEAFNSIDPNLYTNSLAMGNSSSRSIYKICKKAAKNGIIIAIIISLARAIGESMAMSIILQSSPDSTFFKSDFFSILNSSSQSLGAYISSVMFADANPEIMRPLLYAFGFLMLIFSMILNAIIILFAFKRKKKNTKQFVLVNKIRYAPNKFKSFSEKIFFKTDIQLDSNDLNTVVKYTKSRKVDYKYSNAYSYWKKTWEYFALVIASIFLLWICFDIIINGMSAIVNDAPNFFSYGKNTVFQSLLNTFLIIITTLVIGFPISLFVAIYLNEYAKNKKVKNVISFFLDSLGSTPSILFGMFGLLFFIQTLGLTNSGALGNSLIAGSLTLVIVIIPVFSRMLEQNLKNIPDEIRQNSFALGNSKFATIWKLIIPAAFNAIISSIISSIGRILSETAPLYLTAGLSSSIQTNLGRPGTTLTTQIYSQIFSTSANAYNVQYQCAFVTMIFVVLLIFIGSFIIPNQKSIAQKLILYKDGLISFLKKN